jgi:hypothetical protein
MVPPANMDAIASGATSSGKTSPRRLNPAPGPFPGVLCDARNWHFQGLIGVSAISWWNFEEFVDIAKAMGLSVSLGEHGLLSRNGKTQITVEAGKSFTFFKPKRIGSRNKLQSDSGSNCGSGGRMHRRKSMACAHNIWKPAGDSNLK